MTNLKLPNMGYKALADSLAGKSGRVTLAYKTQAMVFDSGPGYAEIEVYHHGNRIAVLSPFSVWLGNANWHSVTTANRLNRIAVDNGLPIRVAIRQGTMTILDNDTLAPIQSLGASGIAFNMVAGLWELRS